MTTTMMREYNKLQAAEVPGVESVSSRLSEGLKRVVDLVDMIYNDADVEMSQVVSSQSKVSERVWLILRRLRESGDYALDIVKTLEIFHLMRDGQLSLNSEELDLNIMLRQIYDLIDNAFEFRKLPVQFLLELDEELPRVRGDSVRLRQAVVNLLTNAAKFTDVGYIRFGAYVDRKQGALVIFVEDTGLGISDADVERIFNAFERGSHDRVGFGLGLALVRGFVEAHGGCVMVQSKQGVGSRFEICLPLDL